MKHAPAAHLETVPRGGLNLWLRLPDQNLTQLSRDCETRGLVITPGDEWFPAEPAGRYLRLNYSGPNPGAFHAGHRCSRLRTMTAHWSGPESNISGPRSFASEGRFPVADESGLQPLDDRIPAAGEQECPDDDQQGCANDLDRALVSLQPR